MQSILVLAADESPRLEYILNELLTNRLGIEYKITTSQDYFLKSNSAKINYGNKIIEGCINIPAVNLLYQEDIKKPEIKTTADARWHITFFNKPFENIPDTKTTTHWLNFDMLAAAFFLLTRYEEYGNKQTDKHGRYNYKNSLAFVNNFLHLPLIDIWVETAKTIIANLYPQLKIKAQQYRQIITVDIDRTYKYKGLSWWGLLKKQVAHIAAQRKEALQQLINFKKHQNDPYDTFKKLTAHNHSMVFFWLLSGNKHKLDKNLPTTHSSYEIIKTLQSDKITHGLHPGYYAAANKKALQQEYLNFKSLFGFEPTLARWHFLKITLPKSFEWLIENNFTQDWSMAYADMPGFRASTALPFKFFNLTTNRETNLLVQPVALMDVSLKNGLQLTPEAAIHLIKDYKNTVKQVNGQFIVIWHNSSFDSTEGWRDWDKVFNEIIND
jgi:hypothetical protein